MNGTLCNAIRIAGSQKPAKTLSLDHAAEVGQNQGFMSDPRCFGTIHSWQHNLVALYVRFIQHDLLRKEARHLAENMQEDDTKDKGNREDEHNDWVHVQTLVVFGVETQHGIRAAASAGLTSAVWLIGSLDGRFAATYRVSQILIGSE